MQKEIPAIPQVQRIPEEIPAVFQVQRILEGIHEGIHEEILAIS